MLVSVVLCAYESKMYDHIREAAESVLNQQYGDVELVIVVDGTDELYDQLTDEYGDDENVVVHLNDENRGLLKSLNAGVRLGSGARTAPGEAMLTDQVDTE